MLGLRELRLERVRCAYRSPAKKLAPSGCARSCAGDLSSESEMGHGSLPGAQDRFRKSYPIVGYLKGPSKPVTQIDVW